MSLKNLLVQVDTREAAKSRLAAAMQLAVRHDSHVTGIAIQRPLSLPSDMPPGFANDVIDSYNQRLDEETEAARALFETAAKKAGVTDRSEWRSATGDPSRLLALHARYADLVIIGQTDPDARHDEVHALPDTLVLEAGGPTLVIPYIGAGKTVGERVLVAWNGSREAARAVADAMPILERAKKVQVLTAKPLDIGELPGADITLHLARHGIKVETADTISDNIGIGDTLLNRISDSGADMLVMGAYGHSRLRETVLGGATRHILRHMTVPVFMSH